MGEEKKRQRNSQTHPDPDVEPTAETASPLNGVDQNSMIEEPSSISLEEYEAMQNELAQAQRKADEFFDGWQRERADFSNYKRRVEREQSQMTQNITGNVARQYLAILDDLERALKTRPTSGEGAAWADGIELIVRKFQGILESQGIQRMDAENEMFDPARHEAISHEDSPDHQSGQIIEVVQPGYLMGDRVLRPALVRVAR
ncbi:MAG TPA: nucleotide exchange factor GrpE [Anaerolineaceae bacterium]|nr:nucleotide exchange factor GrpE [Anaerolineaceae bacterium]